MDYGRPLTPDQIEEERKNLMDLITKLERENKISLRKKQKMGILEGEEAADDSEPLHLTFGKSSAVPKPDPEKAAECFQAGIPSWNRATMQEAVHGVFTMPFRLSRITGRPTSTWARPIHAGHGERSGGRL